MRDLVQGREVVFHLVALSGTLYSYHAPASRRNSSSTAQDRVQQPVGVLEGLEEVILRGPFGPRV